MKDKKNMFISKNEVKKLVIHCSDTPNTENLTALDIHKMHLSFGWDGIGYHKVIQRNGKIENGRPEFWIGAHTYGINEISLGICLIGRNKFTVKQYSSLKDVLKKWVKDYPQAEILGHSDAIFTKKTCPNFDVKKWCRENLLI